MLRSISVQGNIVASKREHSSLESSEGLHREIRMSQRRRRGAALPCLQVEEFRYDHCSLMVVRVSREVQSRV